MFDKIIKIEISASTVAWYGAILATLSLSIGILNYLRDKSRIKISYHKGIRVIGEGKLYDPKKVYFNVTVINRGRRPINISKAGTRILNKKEKKFAIFSDSFNPQRIKVLTEVQPSTEFLIEQDDEELKHTWYVWAQDATGRMYRKYIYIAFL